MAKAWMTLSAAELGRRIDSGAIHAVELTEAFLDACMAHPLHSRIYARLSPGRARAEAMAAHGRARTGLRRHPLDGVPVSWKDLFDTAGLATEAGSALLKGRVPDRDAEVLARATRAGLVCLGKTHMSELAFSGLGLNPVTATPPNVNFDAAVPGGSSSGAAASVAFGLAPIAIGSDTGGSVRVPAAWNDLVGLKTTHGLLPDAGLVPLCPRFDTTGPLGQSVEDCALALSALTGEAPVDLAGARLAGLRLAVLETIALDDLRPEPAAAFEDALARLARQGAQITRLSVPALAEAMALAGPLFTAEAWATWGAQIAAAPELVFARIRERFEGGASVMASDYIGAWQRLDRLRAGWAEAVSGVDAVLTPTCPILPPDAGRLMEDMEFYVTENLLTLRNTRIGNLMGGCGLSLPTAQPSCGLQLLAGPGAEARLLRIGAAAERALR